MHHFWKSNHINATTLFSLDLNAKPIDSWDFWCIWVFEHEDQPRQCQGVAEEQTFLASIKKECFSHDNWRYILYACTHNMHAQKKEKRKKRKSTLKPILVCNLFMNLFLPVRAGNFVNINLVDTIIVMLGSCKISLGNPSRIHSVLNLRFCLLVSHMCFKCFCFNFSNSLTLCLNLLLC